jgi:hypothetical protein
MRLCHVGMCAIAGLLAGIPLKAAQAQQGGYYPTPVHPVYPQQLGTRQPYYGAPGQYDQGQYGSGQYGQGQYAPQPGLNGYRGSVISQASGSEDGTVEAIGEGRLIMRPYGTNRLDPLQGMNDGVPVFNGDAAVNPNVLAAGTPVRVYYRQGPRNFRQVIGIDLMGQTQGRPFGQDYQNRNWDHRGDRH